MKNMWHDLNSKGVKGQHYLKKSYTYKCVHSGHINLRFQVNIDATYVHELLGKLIDVVNAYLCDDKIRFRKTAISHLLGDRTQMVVNLLHHNLRSGLP